MNDAIDPTALYQQVILDRSRRPHHMHGMDPCDAQGLGDNPFCGDRIAMRLRYAPDGRVSDAAFEGRGCAISLAAADLLAEAAVGRTPHELRRLRDGFETLLRQGIEPGDEALAPFLPLSGVREYPSRMRCATLPWSALIEALDMAHAHG